MHIAPALREILAAQFLCKPFNFIIYTFIFFFTFRSWRSIIKYFEGENNFLFVSVSITFKTLQFFNVKLIRRLFKTINCKFQKKKKFAPRYINDFFFFLISMLHLFTIMLYSTHPSSK